MRQLSVAILGSVNLPSARAGRCHYAQKNKMKNSIRRGWLRMPRFCTEMRTLRSRNECDEFLDYQTWSLIPAAISGPLNPVRVVSLGSTHLAALSTDQLSKLSAPDHRPPAASLPAR